MTRLCELEWFTGIYKKIYDVLSVEGLLPHACEITVLPPTPVPPEVRSRSSTVHGMYNVKSKIVWFERQPPDLVVYAHELIHAVYGKEFELEEVYAYNLSTFVVMLAERDIIPPVNPIRMLKDVTVEDILEALHRAYGHRFNNILEYFEIIGVVPVFAEMDLDFESGRSRLRIKDGYDDKLISIVTVSEIIAGAEFDKHSFKVLLELLKILDSKKTRFFQLNQGKGERRKTPALFKI